MATAAEIQRHVDQAHEQAMVLLVAWLNERLKEEIRAPKWEYPTPPRVRDIISSGRLLNSQAVVRLPDGSFEIRWPVDYALEVHEGGVSPEYGRFPGRPWTLQPLQELPGKYSEFLQIALKQGAPR